MASGERYFGRYYKLTIRPPGGKTMVFETTKGNPAMDIKFNVTYARGQLAREGTVSICGLTLDTIHKILSLSAMARDKAMSQLATLTLQAGYFSSAGTVEVLNGFMWYASVTAPPDLWVTIKVSEYNPLGGVAAQITCEKNTPLADFLNHVCIQYEEAEEDALEEAGGGGEITYNWWDGTEDYLVESGDINLTCQFSEEMTLQDCIRRLSKELSNDVQFTLRTFASETAEGTRMIEVLDKEAHKATNGEVQVDEEHGLLSVTGIDCISGCITTFIDGAGDDNLCHLTLKSWLNPQANGRYYITKKEYVGHYMGPEWYVRYYCSGKEGDEES
ncbi:MAG: hypothetical protein J6Q22_10880 [Prevotella sp.]|nr:hypothetical protein [Prevotella sp.]